MSQENPLPPLPEPAMEDVDYELWGQNAVHAALFTADQMHSYAESARAQVLEVLRRLIEGPQNLTPGSAPERVIGLIVDVKDLERARSLINPDQATGSER